MSEPVMSLVDGHSVRHDLGCEVLGGALPRVDSSAQSRPSAWSVPVHLLMSGSCPFMAFGAPSLIHGGESQVYGTDGRREMSVLVGKPVD